MDEQSLKPTLEKLEHYYSICNERFYGNELQKAVITVSPDARKRAYGWCTTWKAWGSGQVKTPDDIADMSEEEIASLNESGSYEINMVAEYLTRPLEEVVGTLLHEMAHLWNIQQGIQDCSRNGYYHNRKFKDAAEAHGLAVEKTEKYGYSMTKLNDEAVSFLKEIGAEGFNLYRKPFYFINKDKPEMPDADEGEKPKQSSRRYVCPGCGNIIRATKVVRVACMDCGLQMLEEPVK